VTTVRCLMALSLLALALPGAAPADIVTSRDRDGVAPDVAEPSRSQPPSAGRSTSTRYS
jgi:hypothetical protein